MTGSGAYVLSSSKDKGARARITGITPGRIVDYGIKDSFNMGCCMAAAASTIEQNLNDFGRKPSDYDKIFTGDLGTVGQQALIDLLNTKGIEISAQHDDCGIRMFDSIRQKTEAGGSGCGCSASVLSAYILPRIESRNGNGCYLFRPVHF